MLWDFKELKNSYTNINKPLNSTHRFVYLCNRIRKNPVISLKTIAASWWQILWVVLFCCSPHDKPSNIVPGNNVHNPFLHVIHLNPYFICLYLQLHFTNNFKRLIYFVSSISRRAQKVISMFLTPRCPKFQVRLLKFCAST